MPIWGLYLLLPSDYRDEKSQRAAVDVSRGWDRAVVWHKEGMGEAKQYHTASSVH